MTNQPKRREVAAIGRCLMCDSYSMQVLDTVPPARALPGRAGTDRLVSLLVGMQDKLATKGALFLRCPTCAEIVYSRPYSQHILDADLRERDCVLTATVLVTFEEGYPPLYLNSAPPERKPKWTLAQGVGPSTLELDRSGSGRIYKPSLRQFGIEASPALTFKDGDVAAPGEAEFMIDATYDAIAKEGDGVGGSKLAIAKGLCPLLKNWDSVPADFLE